MLGTMAIGRVIRHARCLLNDGDSAKKANGKG